MNYIEGKRVSLRLMEEADYWGTIGWLNDQEVTRWMQKPYPQTEQSMKAYAESMKDPNLYLAIYLNGQNKHIGNISMRDNRDYNYHSEISIVIGDKSEWGKGYATDAIKLLTDYCFNTRNIHKLRAGAVVCNEGCIKAFVGAGFRKETIESEAVYAQGKFRDIVIMTYHKNDWRVNND